MDIPIGLELLRMCQYKDPLERWQREDWLELGEILDMCSKENNDCNRDGCNASCDYLLKYKIGCDPSQFGYKEKANAKSYGEGRKAPDRSDPWIPPLTIKGFKDNIIRC